MKNRWNESEASQHTSDMEQRVYSSRLLGADPGLVLHGGGNTSVKTEIKNLFGDTLEALLIKGSGWDLATIEAPGFPAVKMDHLLKLRNLSTLSDPDMVNELRTHLLDSSSPNPSVEALLHAFIPEKFVDHTHADAILTITNQPDGEEQIRNLFGDRVGIVPYIMPGFALAKACIEVYEKNPKVEGLVLLKHGMFTFGQSAKESYDRMINFVVEAEDYIKKTVKHSDVTATPPNDTLSSQWTLALRGALLKRGFSCVAQIDTSDETLQFVNHPKLEHLSQQGPVTPDHVIRTKRLPLLVSSQGDMASNIEKALGDYQKSYDAYFENGKNLRGIDPQQLDPWPRVALIPGVGVITFGSTAKAAQICMDIYRRSMAVMLNADAMNGYSALPAEDIFDMEYWVLEQAKLKKGGQKLPLTGKVAVVSGGASGIGLSIAREFLNQGASVAVLDLDDSKGKSALQNLKSEVRGGGRVLFQKTDVTQRSEIEQSFRKIISSFGGIDICVVNAGIFPASAEIELIPEQDWERSLNVNLTGSFHFVGRTLECLKKQGVGGDILFIASKNVPAPGKRAGAYSVAKAGQQQLARICALEGGAHGIRVNSLHPHLIFDTGIWTDEVIESRAKSYGMTVEEYKTNNLLKTELNSRDVARAAFALVGGFFSKTTGAQIPLDGGSERTL